MEDTQEELDRLQHEVAALREELWTQWEENHFEHCSREWPHPPGRECYWELPAILAPKSSG